MAFHSILFETPEDGPPPVQPGADEAADAQMPPEPDAPPRPKTARAKRAQSKRAKAEKTAGADKRGGAKSGDTGDAGAAAAAGAGAPIVTYLRGTRIAPAPLPPAGTLLS